MTGSGKSNSSPLIISCVINCVISIMCEYVKCTNNKIKYIIIIILTLTLNSLLVGKSKRYPNIQDIYVLCKGIADFKDYLRQKQINFFVLKKILS